MTTHQIVTKLLIQIVMVLKTTKMVEMTVMTLSKQESRLGVKALTTIVMDFWEMTIVMMATRNPLLI